MTHWADVEAASLLEKHDGKIVFATAITPSGPIHVGNMREVLTSEAIFRAVKDAGGDAEFIYIADDYDPLRKVYPFLHDSYQEHVGKPLREIPCPDEGGRPNGCGAHDSYAAHFLEPFLGNLHELGIAPTVLSAYDMYKEGRYAKTIEMAMARLPEIREIIERISKRQLARAWSPFNPQCPTTGKIGDVRVTGIEGTLVTAEGPAGEFTVDATEPGTGKLAWRIDWPARWTFLDVGFEASGKDHRAAGGSWDTGVVICKDIFGHEPPTGLMYEFLNLKGKGAMHSSSGVAVSAADMLRMTPPEVLRYLLMRQSPRKSIDFDPGLGVMNLVNEFDRFERIAWGQEDNPGTFTEVERTYELSCPHGKPDHLPNKVAYSHLVTVSQMADTVEGVEAILRRSGELTGDLDAHDRRELEERVAHVRFWLERFAPDNVRFQVQADRPYRSEDDAAILSDVHDALRGLATWDGGAIHDALYEVKESRDIKPNEVFGPVYRAILGQDRGPRAGFFLASLEREWVLARLAA
ncbi:MAG: lysine--tRNA ligase [Thermoplasmatota archaeon]